MSLKKNIINNYVSQIYVTIVGIGLVPVYVKYMGAEAYGLVGFFAMMQGWFSLLDLGLSPTISRESARYHGGAISALAYRQLFRSLSLIFAFVALAGGGALLSLSDLIATRWLNVKELIQSEVIFSVQVMAVSVALRWMGGLYRGVITGSERLVWISGFNALIATMRFFGVLVSMFFFGFTPFVFFCHQFFVVVIEVAGLFLMAQRLLPLSNDIGDAIGWSLKPIQPFLKFALTIAFTSSVWVLVTQTDKLILSGILPLAEYGYFTLAVMVAGGVTVVSGPISAAIMPRMARLHAEGKHDELLVAYRNSTRFVSVIAGAAAITVGFCSNSLLYAWTGNAQLADQAGPILKLYAFGNGFLAVSAFPYYLQYAKGNLRYHLMGSVVMVGILVPAVIYAAYNFGAIGAGYVWLYINAIYLVTWVGYVHNKLQPGLHFSWLISDVVVGGLPALLVGFTYSFLPKLLDGRLGSLFEVLLTGFLALGLSSLTLPTVRRYLVRG